MSYLVRYTPEAIRDMDAVWDGVYEALKSYDIADRYIEEFADTITAKRPSNFLEFRLNTVACLRGSIL